MNELIDQINDLKRELLDRAHDNEALKRELQDMAEEIDALKDELRDAQDRAEKFENVNLDALQRIAAHVTDMINRIDDPGSGFEFALVESLVEPALNFELYSVRLLLRDAGYGVALK